MSVEPRHFLPDRVRDLAPPAAERLETLRRRLLDHYLLRGYEFVNPPLLEYADTLSSGAASDLKRNLVYLAENADTADASARLALRADFTPQVARLDSIRAAPHQVSRYCYAGTILLRQPRSFNGVRNPMQLGAELLGSSGELADLEILTLLLDSLMPLLEEDDFNCNDSRDNPHNRTKLLRLSDNRIIHQLCDLAQLEGEIREQILSLLQRRSLNQLAPLLEPRRIARPEVAEVIAALIQLPAMFGADLINSEYWAQLAGLDSRLAEMLKRLEQLAHTIAAAHPELQLVIDLADMSGYTYHTAHTFTLFNGHTAIAQGGRYDGIGSYFGYARPAIGFSIDMDSLLFTLPQPPLTPCVWVAAGQLPAAKEWIDEALATGRRVIHAVTSDEQPPTNCTHRLTKTKQGDWELQPITSAHTRDATQA